MPLAEMEMREVSRGDFVWNWTASGNRAAGEGLTPVWPAVDATVTMRPQRFSTICFTTGWVTW